MQKQQQHNLVTYLFAITLRIAIRGKGRRLIALTLEIKMIDFAMIVRKIQCNKCIIYYVS